MPLVTGIPDSNETLPRIAWYHRGTKKTEFKMPARTAEPCLECGDSLEINESGVSFPIFGRTVGIKPRFESSTRMVYVCAECCLSIAMGKTPPPSKPLSQAIYEAIREMTAHDNAALIIAAWQQLRKRLELPPAPVPMIDGELIPPKRLAG